MPPKRKAAGGRKPSPARKKAAAAAPPPEEVTTVTLFEFDKRWHGPLLEMFQEREQTDVVVSAGDHSVGAHRILLSAISPYFRAQFSGKFGADSQSREFRLQELSGPGVAAVVEFAYTGKVDLSGSTVVGIIRAANLLQVEVVEQAAVDFLVAGLDPGNVHINQSKALVKPCSAVSAWPCCPRARAFDDYFEIVCSNILKLRILRIER